ncbi:MAG: hydrolase [Cycloclasticus sp. symbiont of Poecilosclerida sp. N]|nr:MAG: hydrolase [Cycloclasticus sp. symbiont of Poecilosclerida sp. N]
MKIKRTAENPSLNVIERLPLKATRPPILFIHGANMSGWCWDEKFMPYFVELGHPSYAVDLRGHGRSGGQEHLSTNSIADYINDIERIIHEIGETPILVGHSLGGLVIQKYIETNKAPACILMASVPVDGLIPSIMDLFINPTFFIQKNLSQLFGTWFSPVDVTRKSVFSGPVDDDVVIRYCTEMQPSSPKVLLDTLWLGLPTKKNPHKLPLLYLGANEDTFFRPEQIEKTARAYHADYINMENTGHAIMLDSHWQESADAINAWLIKQSI